MDSYFLTLVLLCVFIGEVSSKPRTSEPPSIKNILVFGGNGLLGAPTVEGLIQAGHKCTLINRGNWYWNSYITIKPHVHHIKFDRMQSLSKCEALVAMLDGGQRFDLVIDFSAYHMFAVNEAVSLLKGRVGLYVYISSDSVYEVCLKNHSNPSIETDAIRSTDPDEMQEYATKDDYGHRKLESEEALEKQLQANGIPYISLRLPDVVGPRDNTYRWWIYQMWMRLQKYLDKPVTIPANVAKQPMSFVYSQDVADLILDLTNNSPDPDVLNQAYNLAFRETFTLQEFLNEIKNLLNISDVEIGVDENSDSFRLFPSVSLGPVDISKAERQLKWSPTPWVEALKDTVQFYETCLSKDEFDVPRRDIIRSMQVYFSDHPFRVLIGVKREYRVDYTASKDEL
ncbi:hypothetical protein LOTGIDRAFT_158251 [Lottia gigantea]|uniref:NAD-dependent epimerase/dehydratase domain-containing protein n=1 Tax=Lottia gigantea TaxID=225164 RepID=V4A7T7_LOTGI|nr:hypothetical protein LOTGIDRAFT_158251 [Lottia gigantea]ESP00024.1 hypothetical protein LOTGIDRAFT_158251 [Lottia gigantea]